MDFFTLIMYRNYDRLIMGTCVPQDKRCLKAPERLRADYCRPQDGVLETQCIHEILNFQVCITFRNIEITNLVK